MLEIQGGANDLVLKFDTNMRDEGWSRRGGRLARALEDATGNVIIDLSKVIWGDPLPILWTACSIANKLREPTKEPLIVVDLGTPRSDNRFLAFLATQGFVDCLPENVTIKWMNESYSSKDRPSLVSSLRTLNARLAYNNPDCIGARLLHTSELDDEGKLSQLIDRFVAEADAKRIRLWLSQNDLQRQVLLHQLRTLIGETLDNAHEHAYASGGYVGLYARYRAGEPESEDEFARWNDALRAEHTNCPTLRGCNCGKQPGWIELFVCDVGLGLAQTLEPRRPQPLLSVSRKLFREPISRHKNRQKVQKTITTGLQLIGNILAHNSAAHNSDRGDFCRLFSSGEWVGEHVHWPVDMLPMLHVNHREGDVYPTGTAFHFSIEPQPAALRQQRAIFPSSFIVPTAQDLVPVRAALARATMEETSLAHDFYDRREESEPATPQGNELAARRSAAWVENRRTGTIVVRTPNVVRKSDLVRQLRLIADFEPWTIKRIVLVDVPTPQAIDIANLLSREVLRFEPWRSSPEFYVVSQDWAVAAFDLRTDRMKFKSNLRLAQQFLRTFPDGFGSGSVATILRARDTDLFWKRVGDAYKDEQVLWPTATDKGESSVTVDGYLDLPQVLSTAARRAARRALRRTIASFCCYSVVTSDEPIRSLVESTFDIWDGHYAVEPRGQSVVVVGSATVTSRTLTRYMARGDFKAAGAVRLLKHGTAVSDEDVPPLTALLWSPPVSGTPTRTRSVGMLERIPNTPFVIRGGERAIPLPRFSAPKDGHLGRSLYGDAPDDAYATWQRLGLLRMGHWTYQGHHDLLTIRLGLALTLHGDRIGSWAAEQLRSWKAPQGQGFGVVYPQHTVAEEFVQIIQRAGFADPDTFFPLQLIRNLAVSPAIVSPTIRTRLGLLFREHFLEGGTLVLLDDGVVTGTTMTQLRQFVVALWENAMRGRRPGPLELKSLAILDRSAIPTDRSMVEAFVRDNARLWRWDVPPLGRESACRLCAVLDRSKSLLGTGNSELDQRLKHWATQWGPVFVGEASGEHGLEPKQLPHGEVTRFCIESSDSGEISHQIRHRVSTSRASVAAEICRSTTRREYPLKKVLTGTFKGGEPFDLQTRIEILCTQILLFLDELPVVERIDRFHTLIDLLWLAPTPSAATALAAMTALCDDSLMPELWRYCHAKIDSQGLPNDDALLCALGLIKAADERPPAVRAHADWTYLRALLTGIDPVRDALRFSFGLFGWDEGSFHQKSHLMRLLKEPVERPSNVTRLILLVETLRDAIVTIQNNDLVGVDFDFQEDAQFLEETLDRLRWNQETVQPVTTGQVATAPKSINRLLAQPEYLAQLEQEKTALYSRLFVNDDSMLRIFRKALTAELSPQMAPGQFIWPIAAELKKNWAAAVSRKQRDGVVKSPTFPIIRYYNALTRKHLIYLDTKVSSVIRDLIANAISRNGDILCPWGAGTSPGRADLWIRYTHDEGDDRVRVEFANGCDDEATPSLRRKPNLTHLISVGGECSLSVDAGVATTILVLPTVNSLVWR